MKRKKINATEGPWYAFLPRGCDGGCRAIRTVKGRHAGGYSGVELAFTSGLPDDEEDKANADILAASRDLYDAARALDEAEIAHANCDYCDGAEIPELCPVCFPLFDDARVKRRLALDKAEGKKP